MALDVILAGIMEQHRAVAESIFIRSHAEHIRCKHEGRLALVAVQLMYCFRPVLSAAEIALVFGNN